MSDIALKINNLDKLQALAERFPAIALKHINEAISRSLVRILGEEKQQAPFGVTGNLRDRWTVNVGNFEGKLTSTSPYALAVHQGTRPHFVSAEALAPWAKNKGLNPYAVAKSIARKGTKANPFLQRSVDTQKANVNSEFKNAVSDIVKEAKF